jgi:hypothetical protein
MAHSSTGKLDSKIATLSVAKDFSPTPGGRYRRQGPNSGEEFREEVLLPRFEEAERTKTLLLIDLDGGLGYASSFLEEAFGGLARLKNSTSIVLRVLRFSSTEEPYLVHDVERYIREALDK